METGKENNIGHFEYFSAQFRLDQTPGLNLFLAPDGPSSLLYGVEDAELGRVLGVGRTDYISFKRHPIAQSPFQTICYVHPVKQIQLIPEPFESSGNLPQKYWCAGEGVWLFHEGQLPDILFPEQINIPLSAVLLESARADSGLAQDVFVLHFAQGHFTMAHYAQKSLQFLGVEQEKTWEDGVYLVLFRAQSMGLNLRETAIRVMGDEISPMLEKLKHFCPNCDVYTSPGLQDPDGLIPTNLRSKYHLLFNSMLCV